MEAEKPLFIPLKKQYFDDFIAGRKSCELRKYGPRWNETSCRVGRPVVLSCGYSAKRRVSARVEGFERIRGTELPSKWRRDVVQCYGHDLLDIAVITIGNLQGLPLVK